MKRTAPGGMNASWRAKRFQTHRHFQVTSGRRAHAYILSRLWAGGAAGAADKRRDLGTVANFTDTDFHARFMRALVLPGAPYNSGGAFCSRGGHYSHRKPGVHLHPAGQALMGQFLTEVARSGVQVIVETHSDHILNGIRRSVRAGKLPARPGRHPFFSTALFACGSGYQSPAR